MVISFCGSSKLDPGTKTGLAITDKNSISMSATVLHFFVEFEKDLFDQVSDSDYPAEMVFKTDEPLRLYGYGWDYWGELRKPLTSRTIQPRFSLGS